MRQRCLHMLGGFLLLCLTLLLVSLAWLHWRPRPAWDVAFGPTVWRMHLDGSQLVRLATHPLSFRLASGRTLNLHDNQLIFLQDGEQLLVRCAPCTIGDPASPRAAVHLAQVDLRLRRIGNKLAGELSAGTITVPWQGNLTQQGLLLQGELPATPAQDIVRLLDVDIPEARHVRVDGSIGVRFTAKLPQRQWQIEPEIQIRRVAGLGTEALRGLQPLPACARPATRGFGDNISKAVIAAEDQRFATHLGYDPQELAAATNPSPHQGLNLRGASTLDEQVARLLFTGASHSPIRKLRELLYAVEMDRTLGKAQIMRLYLSLAPWGDGVCGAEAAAQHYFAKPANHLAPQEAAWLASLLRNPAQAHSAPETVRRHALWVLKGMHGLSHRERQLARHTLTTPEVARLP